MQRRLARVRRPNQRDLRRALGPNDQRRTATCAASLGTVEFFGQFLDAPLDIALEMVGSLMLWDRAQHLPQPLQALPGVARLRNAASAALYSGVRLAGMTYQPSARGIRQRLI